MQRTKKRVRHVDALSEQEMRLEELVFGKDIIREEQRGENEPSVSTQVSVVTIQHVMNQPPS